MMVYVNETIEREKKVAYLTTQELSEYLDVHVTTVRRWVSHGMPHILGKNPNLVGGPAFYFKIGEVRAWLRDNGYFLQKRS